MLSQYTVIYAQSEPTVEDAKKSPQACVRGIVEADEWPSFAVIDIPISRNENMKYFVGYDWSTYNYCSGLEESMEVSAHGS